MADIKTEYLLTTPGQDITFNDGALGDGVDKYWLTSIQGLDGPAIRAPVDLVPFGDGGLIHTFRKGPRRVVFDGMLLMESSTSQADCQEIRNNLAWDLKDALATMLTASWTLTWTPTGESAQSLTVYYEVGVDFPYSENYMVQNFSFGLISPAADPS
jgi:hypothetical protein